MGNLFDGTLGTVFYFIVALSTIVSIHEYGHYIVGRWCGVHAEVFSIGFGPILFSTTDKKGTRWQLALIPMGGYVKFLDDDVTNPNLKSAKLTGGLNGASLSRRAAIIFAGPAFNFLFSILIFSSIFQYSGGISDLSIIGKLKNIPDLEETFIVGDHILEIEGQDVKDFSSFLKVATTLRPQKYVSYKVLRNNEFISFKGTFPFLPLVDHLQPKSPAIKAGLLVGDLILELDGTPVYSLSSVQEFVSESMGRAIKLKVWRNKNILEIMVEPKRQDIPLKNTFVSKWLIGFSGGLFFEPVRKSVSLDESLAGGVKQTWNVISSSIFGLTNIIAGTISSCNLQGPLGIAEASGDIARQGFVDFIWFIGIMSTAIGLINLFPIPVLDGGHLVFIAFEAITRRPLNNHVQKWLTLVGVGVLLSLMIFALSNDLFC
jgi:regulator of sigma E protease